MEILSICPSLCPSIKLFGSTALHAMASLSLAGWWHIALLTRLDQCNSVLAGISGYLQDRLQSVLNAAARLVYSRQTSEHTTPLLQELLWLRVPERIQFQLCVLVYCCVHGTSPAYLVESLQLKSEIVAHRYLRCIDSLKLLMPSSRQSALKS